MGPGTWLNTAMQPILVGQGFTPLKMPAPDLCDGPLLAAERPFKPIDHQARMPTRTPRDGHARGGSTKLERAVILDSEQSAALREKLLTQLGNIILADLAAAWAREALSAPRTASQQPMPSSWRRL